MGEFLLPQECGLSTFDPDLGLDLPGFCPRPMPNAKALELASEELAIYGYTIEESDYKSNPEIISSDVGDDEESVSNSKLLLALNSVFSREIGLRTSRKDTSINPRYGNFCEELIVLPDGYDQTYQKARNTSSYADMSFIDIPKLRLAIPIRPMRMDHSSTFDGKAGMVGSRLKWLPNDNPLKIVYEVFNLYQDVNLGMIHAKKFAYLPTELGGYGKPIPFSNFKNFEKFNSAFKAGTHAPVVRVIVRRALRYLEKISNGIRPPVDELLSHVTRFSSSFHDWVKGKSIHAPTAWIDIPEDLRRFQVGELGLNAVEDDVFCRLIAERHLVTEAQLQVVVEHNHLCKALSGAVNIKEFQELRESAIRQWRKLSVFGRETYGLIKEIVLDQNDFRPLQNIEVLVFNKKVEERKGILKPLFRAEPVYLRDAIDHVYKQGPMYVPFQMTPRNKIGTMQFVEQRRFREDVVDTEDRQAEPLLLEWVKNGKVGDLPRRLINDDNEIIRKANGTGGLIIVTDDIALCKKANRVTGTPIFRVPCEWYYRCLYFNGTEPWKDFLRNRTHIEWEQVTDDGSLTSAEENLFDNGQMLVEYRRMPFSLTKGLHEKDTTILTYSEDYSDVPKEHPDSLLYDRMGLVSRRRAREFRSENG
nr:MAG: hypothetical protein [Leptosphaeria biglobosa narnavirus 6]